MIHRRLFYLAVLLAAFILQITSESYLGRFLFTLALALPVLSLLLSLPGMLACRLTLSARPRRLLRGEKGDWLLVLETPAGLPLARLSLRLTERNLFTGRVQRRTVALSGTPGGPVSLSAGTDHCGLLELSADRVRVLDYLGLFSLRRPAPERAVLLTAPIAAEPRPVPMPEGGGVRLTSSGTSKSGPGEDYDLREYRPGDPMRAVHWKLSSKWDELIVRERTESVTPMPLITFDRGGGAEDQDRVMDKLEARCRTLLSARRPFAVLWPDGEGRPDLRRVSDEKELEDCLTAVLSSPPPPAGTEPDALPKLIELAGEPIFRLHLAAGEEDSYG